LGLHSHGRCKMPRVRRIKGPPEDAQSAGRSCSHVASVEGIGHVAPSEKNILLRL
jgi:hypothetical protein